MKNSSPKVDAYIANAPDFARPILERLRKVMHKACPDIEETMKWSRPCFERFGIVAGMAAFKQHVSFGFWKQDELSDPEGLYREKRGQTMMQNRLTSMKDLPPDKVLIAYAKEAAKLNEEAAKAPKVKRPKTAKTKKVVRTVEVPDYFLAALARNKKAQATFEKFSYSHKKEYVEWITEAKREETREKRIATALEWLAEGKPKNWKYMNC